MSLLLATLVPPTTITGTLNKTLANVTLASQVEVLVKGTLNKTLGAVTSLSASKVLVKGSLDKTLDPLTSSSIAQVIIKGTLDTTLGALMLSSTGTTGGGPAAAGATYIPTYRPRRSKPGRSYSRPSSGACTP